MNVSKQNQKQHPQTTDTDKGLIEAARTDWLVKWTSDCKHQSHRIIIQHNSHPTFRQLIVTKLWCSRTNWYTFNAVCLFS